MDKKRGINKRFRPKINNNHQTSPIFKGNNLVATGVQMEGYSIDDSGKSICFNIFAYNVQPGVDIDYQTGVSKLLEELKNNSAVLYINWKNLQKTLDKSTII